MTALKGKVYQHLQYQNHCIAVIMPILNHCYSSMQEKPEMIPQHGNSLLLARMYDAGENSDFY